MKKTKMKSENDVLVKAKKKYDGKSIGEVEGLILKNMNSYVGFHKKFILDLFYLCTTKRYKESKGFEKASWEVYLKEKFDMSENSYNSNKWAYILYPKESKKLGPGMLIKIKKVAGGAGKVEGILKEMKGKTRGEREEILEVSTIEKPKKETLTSWKGKFYNERSMRIDSERENVKKDKQIVKLKATIVSLKKEVAQLKEETGKIEEVKVLLSGTGEDARI